MDEQDKERRRHARDIKKHDDPEEKLGRKEEARVRRANRDSRRSWKQEWREEQNEDEDAG